MKITDVKVQEFKHRTSPFRFRDGFPPYPEELDVLAIRILTDEEVEGHSLSLACHGGVSSRFLAELIRTVIRPLVVGENPLYRERIWQKMWDFDLYAKMPVYAHGPIDVALWDLGGKVAGLPVYKMLGAYRDKVPAYASTTTLAAVDDYPPLALSLKERGFKAMKLHVWGDPERDIAAFRAVREAVGEDMVLMFDAAMAYNHEEALWVGRQLEKLGCYFYESPLRDYDLRGLKELSAQLDIPVAVSEEGYGSFFYSAQFIEQRAGDILRGDVSQKGGITGLLKLAHVCEAYGIMCEIHVGTDPFAEMANLHVMCAIQNCAYYELIVPEGLRHFGVKEPPITIDQEGYVHVSNKPGIGLEVDWDKIDAAG